MVLCWELNESLETKKKMKIRSFRLFTMKRKNKTVKPCSDTDGEYVGYMIIIIIMII